MATKQLGIITYEQLNQLGFAPAAVHWAAHHGGLTRVCRGLYRLGTLRPTWMHLAFATTRLMYPGSALSHFSAAHLFGLPDCDAPVKRLELTVPYLNCSPCLPRYVDVTRSRIVFGRVLIEQFFVTPLARNMIDLCSLVTPRRLEVLLDKAFLKDRNLGAHLRLELARFKKNGRSGLSLLRNLLESRTGRGAESPLETLFHQSARHFNFNLVAQVDILEPDGRFVTRADAANIELMIAVFVDSLEWHSGRAAFDRDARQRSRAGALGWLVLVVTSTSINSGAWVKDMQDAVNLRTKEKANK